MLQYEKPTTGIWPLLRFGDVLYHSIVRVVRQKKQQCVAGADRQYVTVGRDDWRVFHDVYGFRDARCRLAR